MASIEVAPRKLWLREVDDNDSMATGYIGLMDCLKISKRNVSDDGITY